MKASTAALAVLLFWVVFFVYAHSRVMTSFDSRWSVHTAVSILNEGNVDLDEYRELLARDRFYGVERVDGHYYSAFPLGGPVLSVPLVYLIDRLEGRTPEGDVPYVIEHHAHVERTVASIFVALAAIVVFASARIFLPVGRALLVAVVFAFCTPAWSTASRALWQHGPSMMLLATALYLLLAARRRPSLAAMAALPLALAYVVRPVNSISVLVLTLYVLVEYRKWFWKYLLWALPVAAVFFALNLHLYDALLPSYFMPGRVGPHPGLGEALAGNLISPARGLFVYSPIFLFCFAGVWLNFRRRTLGRLDLSLVAIVLLHWLVISSFPHWWAGHSFGPRFFTDMAPYLIFLMLPLWVASTNRKRVTSLALALAVLVSLAIHYRGANSYDVYRWNAEPENVDSRPERLWDWKDPQFLRGL